MIDILDYIDFLLMKDIMLKYLKDKFVKLHHFYCFQRWSELFVVSPRTCKVCVGV